MATRKYKVSYKGISDLLLKKIAELDRVGKRLPRGGIQFLKNKRHGEQAGPRIKPKRPFEWPTGMHGFPLTDSWNKEVKNRHAGANNSHSTVARIKVLFDAVGSG